LKFKKRTNKSDYIVHTSTQRQTNSVKEPKETFKTISQSFGTSGKTINHVTGKLKVAWMSLGSVITSKLEESDTRHETREQKYNNKS